MGVPFTVKDDLIAENTEHFGFSLSVPENTPSFTPGTNVSTDVRIIDDECELCN